MHQKRKKTPSRILQKEKKVIIKESRRLIFSEQETELYVIFYPESKGSSEKTIHIPGNSPSSNHLRCKFKISSFENNLELKFVILDYISSIVTVYLKTFIHANKKNSLLLEDIITFDNTKKQKSIFTKISPKEEVFFFYITLVNNTESDDDNISKPLGIINEGNTSYMDVIIQNLYWLSYIRRMVYKMKPSKDSFIYHLQEIFYYLQTDTKPVTLNKMLNCLMKKSSWNKNKDPFDELFNIIDLMDQEGIVNLFKIVTKKHKIKTQHYLSVELKSTIEDSITALAKNKKKDFFIELPNVLLIQLNRFNEDNHRKDCSYVQFKQILSLSSYTSDVPCNKSKYLLFSVIVHEGKSLSNGFFYSYVKSPDQRDTWWKLQGTISKKSSDLEVFEQNYGGEYDSYSFPEEDSPEENIIVSQKENDKTAYGLIYINEFYLKSMFPDFMDQEIPDSIIARCQEQKEKENQSQISLNESSEHSNIKQTKRFKFYTQMRSSSPNDISFFSEVNQIYLNTIVNTQPVLADGLENDSITQRNNNNINNFNNNTSLISIIQPLSNEHQGINENMNESMFSVKLFNDSFLYFSTNTSKRYLKVSFTINLVHNETNKVIQQIQFDDTPIDKDTTSIMFLPICHQKIPSNLAYDISLFKLVLLTTKGLYIKIINDLDEIGSYIQLHYEKKVILCLYTIEMEILMELNNIKKLISINYYHRTSSLKNNEEENNIINDINYPVLICNSNLYDSPKRKCLRVIQQLVEKYSNDEEVNGIYIVKHFGNTIKEVIQRQNVDLEDIDDSCYDILQQMKVVRFVVK